MAFQELLPEDVTRIILSMLPVKSLMRFKCVSKSWYALIKSRAFVQLHLKHGSLNKNKDCLIIRRFIQHDHRHVLSFFSNETLDDLSINIDIPWSKDRSENLIMLGACNGIICITDSFDIALCNPSIREFKSLAVTPLFGPDKMVHWPEAVGFGFDPNTGDYKVVRIVNHFENLDDYGYDPGCTRAEVYNLSTNSWREIDAAVPAKVFYAPCFETLFNGAFHWYAGENLTILSFHISNEVMQLIPLPDICSVVDGHRKSLDVLNESLAIIRYEDQRHRHDVVEKHFDIWVMKEYGVKESWTRLFKIGPLLGIRYPLTFWKNNEILLETSDAQLVSYDLQNHVVKKFPIYGDASAPGPRATLGVLLYSESLVSITGEN